MTACETCGKPGATKTTWGRYLCDYCFNHTKYINDKDDVAGVS